MARVLVVDDYPDLTKVMKVLLTREGHIVDTCFRSDEVFSKIYSFIPDIVILDVFLDNETGRSLCLKMKDTESLKNIPVILFSSHSLTPQIVRDCKCNGFIQKPFEIHELLSTINSTLETSVVSK